LSSRLLIALRVAGPPERAFRVFTEETALWWRPNGLFGFTAGAPGQVAFEPPAEGAPGRFVEQGQGGRTFVIGEISIWEPPHRLAFAWRQASFAADQTTEVEISFEPVGEETRVTVQHHGWDSVPQTHVARHGFPPVVFAQRHGEWWRALLTGLKDRLS
jgi:uncharacterized protein YndB with AHSA1/START domain